MTSSNATSTSLQPVAALPIAALLFGMYHRPNPTRLEPALLPNRMNRMARYGRMDKIDNATRRKKQREYRHNILNQDRRIRHGSIQQPRPGF